MKPVVPDAFNITIMGMPYHGLVKNGSMDLPNGGTLTVAQPGASNTLLAKTVTPPDRSGNELDTANGYQWKDRHLLAGITKPPANHFIYIDSNDRAWLILITIEIVGKTFQVKARVVRRWGLLDYIDPVDVDVDFFTGSVIDLSGFASSHGLSSLSSTPAFVEQNPRGDEVLIGISGSFGSPVSRLGTPAAVFKLTITGGLSVPGGVGAIGTGSLYKTVTDCAPIPSETVTDTRVYKTYEEERYSTYTCDGSTYIRTLFDNLKATVVGNISGFASVEGDHLTEFDQTSLIYAYYSEDGIAHIVEEQTTDYQLVTWTFDWEYHRTRVSNYTVGSIASTGPPITYFMTATGKTDNWTSIINSGTGTTKTHTVNILIDGLTKSTTVSDATSNSTTTDTRVVVSNFVQANTVDECRNETTTPIITTTYLDPTPSPDSLGAPDYVKTGSSSSGITLTAGGASVYDGPLLESISETVAPDVRQLSNRLWGMDWGDDVSVYSIDEYYDVVGDSVQEIGVVPEYASYNPYDGTMERDTVPVGFL